MAKKKKETKPSPPAFPKVLETFYPISDWDLSRMKRDSHFCFNSQVGFKKYRITVEIIEEPIDVYQERLEHLWITCDNYHHWMPLQVAADSIGYQFKGERGSQRIKRI